MITRWENRPEIFQRFWTCTWKITACAKVKANFPQFSRFPASIIYVRDRKSRNFTGIKTKLDRGASRIVFEVRVDSFINFAGPRSKQGLTRFEKVAYTQQTRYKERD